MVRWSSGSPRQPCTSPRLLPPLCRTIPSIAHQYPRITSSVSSLLLARRLVQHLCGPPAVSLFFFLRTSLCVCATTSSGAPCTFSTCNFLPSLLFAVISSSSLLTSFHCLIISEPIHISSLRRLVLFLRAVPTSTHVLKGLSSQNAA